MIEIATRDPKNGAGHVAAQPIALAAGALIVIVLGAGAMALWRSHAANAPVQDRLITTVQLQPNSAQASEELSEKTRALEATQQESIDQLQTLQDQLQTAKQQLTAQQADTRRLAEQVSSLTEAIDTLRQSFASARAAEASAPSVGRQPARTKSESSKTADRKRAN